MSVDKLASHTQVVVQQRKELFELLGYETRNKYEVLSTSGESLFFVTENQKGILGFFLRQSLGHWRSFELSIFNTDRREIARARHPFKFLFQEMHLQDLESGKELGFSKKRFSILSKKFSVHLPSGDQLEITSPIWRIWTFQITKNGAPFALIKKRWSGGLKEIFTDADNFSIEFTDNNISPEVKLLIITLAVLIDLSYFETKK